MNKLRTNYNIVREGAKLVYTIPATDELVDFSIGTDNGSSLGVELVREKGVVTVTATAKQQGYAALTVLASRKSDGVPLAVFGEQVFVVGPEQALPIAGSMEPRLSEVVAPVDTSKTETATKATAPSSTAKV